MKKRERIVRSCVCSLSNRPARKRLPSCRKICNSAAGHSVPSSSIIPYRNEYELEENARQEPARNRRPPTGFTSPYRSQKRSPGCFPRIGPEVPLVNCRDILKTLRESCTSNDAALCTIVSKRKTTFHCTYRHFMPEHLTIIQYFFARTTLVSKNLGRNHEVPQFSKRHCQFIHPNCPSGLNSISRRKRS